MTTKSKTFIIILCTLLIGIIIGAIGSGSLRQKRIERFNRLGPERQFIYAIENIINPTSEQRKKMREILERNYERIAEIRHRHQSEIISNLDSLKKELSNVLTDEQLKNLNRFQNNFFSNIIQRRIAFLDERLELTDEQKKKIEKIFQQPGLMPGEPFPDDFRPIPPPDSDGWKDLNRMRQDFRDNLDKINNEIEEVLTPEQRKTFRQIFKDSRFPFGPRPGPFRNHSQF